MGSLIIRPLPPLRPHSPRPPHDVPRPRRPVLPPAHALASAPGGPRRGRPGRGVSSCHSQVSLPFLAVLINIFFAGFSLLSFPSPAAPGSPRTKYSSIHIRVPSPRPPSPGLPACLPAFTLPAHARPAPPPPGPGNSSATAMSIPGQSRAPGPAEHWNCSAHCLIREPPATPTPAGSARTGRASRGTRHAGHAGIPLIKQQRICPHTGSEEQRNGAAKLGKQLTRGARGFPSAERGRESETAGGKKKRRRGRRR